MFKFLHHRSAQGTEVAQPQENGLSLSLWILVVLLLVGFPAFTIWRYLLPFYADIWAVVQIVLIVFSIIAGLQLLNRYPAALKNAKILIVMNLLYVAAIVVAYPGSDGWWMDIIGSYSPLIRMAILGSFVFFSKRGRALFPDAPIPRRKPWLIFKRYYAGNIIGQLFIYGIVILLVVAVSTTTPSSPSDGSSKRDSAQEKASSAWLEEHPDNLEQLMGESTGVKPTLSTPAPGTAVLDAKSIYEQKSPAVVVIFTNTGSGAGFFLTADGVIATSYHVLSSSSDAVVMMKSGKLYAISSILTCNRYTDFCLFKIDIADAPFVTLGDFASVAIGDPVVVIGHPYGYTYSLSNGLVSEIHEYDKAGTFFQFTAPASSGNSGGPVFNTAGEVIGITNSLIASNDAQNLNFAMAVSSLRKSINPQLIK